METLMSDPDSVQKALPHPPEGFLVFFGARRRRVGGLGRPYLRALVALGRSWGKPLVGSRRSRIKGLRPLPPTLGHWRVILPWYILVDAKYVQNHTGQKLR